MLSLSEQNVKSMALIYFRAAKFKGYLIDCSLKVLLMY